MNLGAYIQIMGQIIDIFGVVVIVGGVVLSTSRFLAQWFSRSSFEAIYKSYRQNLGRVILLGLELLVAGDIIKSVGGQPSFSSVIILAILVLIRSFLSITFDMEVSGSWPWNKKR